MLIELNSFLKWAMWPMGLLFTLPVCYQKHNLWMLFIKSSCRPTSLGWYLWSMSTSTLWRTRTWMWTQDVPSPTISISYLTGPLVSKLTWVSQTIPISYLIAPWVSKLTCVSQTISISYLTAPRVSNLTCVSQTISITYRYLTAPRVNELFW